MIQKVIKTTFSRISFVKYLTIITGFLFLNNLSSAKETLKYE